MEKNNLTMEDIKKKKNFQAKDKYVVVDEEKEANELIDPSKLKITSSRKLWKIKKGFPIKKKNYTAEKKGVFN